jgi:pilus assembly protein CpaB
MLMRVALIGLILIGALGLGGVALVALSPEEAPAVNAAAPPPPPAVQAVLVAARPLRPGALVKPEDITVMDFPTATLPAGARPDTRENRAELTGAMIRRALPQGEPLAGTDMLRPGEHGFLAAVLGSGMRAISVGVDQVSGHAGLIWPGDRVDLVLTQALDDQALPLARRIVGETVLADVRIIAVDQQLIQGASGDSADPLRAARTVTLEVTPRGAERVSVASRLGRLSLSLRSAERSPATEGNDEAPTWAGDVSPALRRQGPDTISSSTIRVYLGGSRREEFRF